MRAGDVSGALRLEGVTARYPGFQVGPVDLTLGPGETLAILGPNGSGKSTLLRVIAGLEPLSSGRIWLGERELTELPPSKRGVGMVFQDLALFPQKTVRANLAYGPTVQGWTREEIDARTEELMVQFRLGEFAERRPDRLSGGERQRVALARALAPRPSALLLDEPLAAADPRSSRTLQAELKGYLRQAGIPSLYVTHDFEEGFFLGSRAALLHEGSWVEEGPSEVVYRAPRQPFTAWFLGYNLLPSEWGGGPPGGVVGALPRDLRVVPEGTPGSHPLQVEEAGASGPVYRVLLRSSLERGPSETIEVHLPADRAGPPPRAGERVGLVVGHAVPLEGSLPPEGFKRVERSPSPAGKDE